MPENDPTVDPVLGAATRIAQSPGGAGLSANPEDETGGLPSRVGHDVANTGGEGGERLPANDGAGTDVDEAGMTGSGGGLGTDAGAHGPGSEEGIASAAGAEAAMGEEPPWAANPPGA